jgi:hypothetical protein
MEVDCEADLTALKTDTYNKTSYNYYKAKTFLSWTEIEEGIVESLKQYNDLRVFDVRYLNLNKETKGRQYYPNKCIHLTYFISFDQDKL